MLPGTITALSALLSLALTVTADAQDPRLTVGPGEVLTAGGTAKISYSDPTSPGANVLVEIDDGALPYPHTVYVVITLDAEGVGSASWSVPDSWGIANFMAPNAPLIMRPIVTSSPEVSPNRA